MNKKDWISHEDWTENHLRSNNTHNERVLTLNAYDKSKPLCPQCVKTAEITLKPKIKASVGTNVLYVKRKIFI